MTFYIAILLGLIQGLTEFLPVSSSGHLLIIEKIFNINTNINFINITLHLATLFAVCLIYRKKLFNLIKHPFCKEMQYLVIATIPAIVFVLAFNSFVDNNLTSSVFLGIGFFVTSILLIISHLSIKTSHYYTPLTYKNSILMGLGQALAIFPGLSRSGTTLTLGLISGVQKNEALDFSFLMSIPIILGGLIYELIKSDVFSTPFSSAEILPLLCAFLTAFLTGLFSIKFMQKLVSKLKLWYFAPYLIVLGVLVIIFL